MNIRREVLLLFYTRPTAVNLFWAIERMKRVVDACQQIAEVPALLLAGTHRLLQEDYEADVRLSEYGSQFIKQNAEVVESIAPSTVHAHLKKTCSSLGV